MIGDYHNYTDRTASGMGRWEGVRPIGQGWAYNTDQPRYKMPAEVY